MVPPADAPERADLLGTGGVSRSVGGGGAVRVLRRSRIGQLGARNMLLLLLLLLLLLTPNEIIKKTENRVLLSVSE